MSVVLEAINYNFYLWNIYGDLKIIGILLVILGWLQNFAASCAFGTVTNLRQTELKKRITFNPGEENVPLVDPEKTLLFT